MAEYDLQEKFPEMRPLKSAPSLWTLNGCGLSIYGSRDYDEETNTYVKTHCLSILFLPILFLGAYRVADAPQGWYFLGKVPLSVLAKLWNWLVLLGIVCVAGLIWYETYTHSADYIAKKQLADADRMAASGKLALAAQLYRTVAQSGTDHARPAMTKFNQLFNGPVAKAPLGEAAEVFKIGIELRGRPGAVDNLYERGLKLADKHFKDDPGGALKVVDAVAPLATDQAALGKIRQRFLERLVKKEPNNPEPATLLALIFETRGDRSKCEKLLTPHRQRLGISEGARILGQVYAQRGKLEEAHALLLPYAEGRLKKLHEAEQAFQDTRTRVWDALWEQVKGGKVPDFPYERFKRAGAAEKQRIQIEYCFSKEKDDPAIKKAGEVLEKEEKVAAVALDLGIVMLRRAQGLADAAARRKELEKAEKIFKAIRNVKPGSDLFLAQVYYWLSKPTEGRKLFKQVLDAGKRRPGLLVTASELLREVGAISEARALAEEAYNQAKENNDKLHAARQRSLVPIDLDDTITWLRRSDPASSEVKAHLSMCLGNKAMQEGNDQEAARHLREGLAIYEQFPQSPAILNNRAILYSSLYRATGDVAALVKRVELLEKALARKPSDSLLLHNLTDALKESACRDLIGSSIDLKVLKTEGTLSLLGYLYNDQAGKDQYVRRVRGHKGIARTVRNYNRFQVLSSKSPGLYSALASIHSFTEDLEALRGLEQRLRQADLDLADSIRQTLDGYKGKKDEKNKKDTLVTIKRYEELVQTTRKKPGGATFAVAATILVASKIGGARLGLEVNADEIVALAEEAHTTAPSTLTHSTLRDALLFRANAAVARQEPTYAALASRTRRSLHHSYLLAVALSQEGKVRQVILDNKDVQRVLALIMESRKQFPKSHDIWSWVMLRTAHPEEAAAIAKGVLADEAGRIKRSIDLKLAPVDAATAIQAYWAMQIAGQEAKGVEILKRCAAQGVPLPLDPK